MIRRMKMNKKKNSFIAYIKSNWIIILLCFVSAVIMWALIMKDENPERTKTIQNVQLVFDGEADLLSRHFVVVGDRDEIIPRITVKVTTDLLKYADLSEANITASVDLRKVNGEGEHELSVTAVSNNGTVVSVYPKTVTITVDRLNQKKVPVEVTTKNSLPSGYEAGDIKVSRDSIQIEGAKGIISDVVKAYYEIDLKHITSGINESVTLTLLDNDNNSVSDSEIYGEIPSVNVSMPVYSVRELGFDLQSALVNTELINPNYEIVNYYTVPEKVKVLTLDEEIFDNYDLIKLDSVIDISGAKSNIEKKVSFTVHEDAWLDEDIEKVEVHIIINEKQVEKTFENVKVKISGESDKYSYTYTVIMADVTIRCGISLANKIDRDNIILTANVSGIDNTDAECSAPISIEFSRGIDATDIYVYLSEESVRFMMKAK